MAKEQVVLTEESAGDFKWKARNPDGKVISGTATAGNVGDVSRHLIERGLIPLKVQQVDGFGMDTEISLRKSVKQRSIVVATRQIATMLDSGLTYLQSLDVVIEDCEDQILRNALQAVREDVRQGSMMADAMARQPQAFPSIVINLIAAGEASGQVKEAMTQVADQLDAQDALRAKVKKAMMYPLVVFVLALIIFMGLMLFLVPSFASMYSELSYGEAKLPKLTMMVVGISNFMKSPAMGVLVAVIVGGLWWLRKNKDKDHVREYLDPFKLKMPVFGKLFHKIALARFCRTLSGLLNAGVSTLEALEITSRTVGNVRLERATLNAMEAHRQGRTLVEPLRDEPLFPTNLITMAQVGEDSGRIGYMLGKAADMYDRDIDQITDNMSALIEPLFMMLIAGMVGTTAIAIYLPYFSIGDVMAE
ncbi:type II secretion system F family protein [Aeromicrobium sp. 179-A 4D2 NHS]|uniref:type II secretion system F family protein n=1 Tax=Aeromicrobium sp. 179-A 4D2 NHS TaxID=3142375 RepID=UPI0039A2FD0A